MPISNLFTQTCNIYRRGGKTTDAFGQASATWGLLVGGASVACRYQPARNSWKSKPELKYTKPSAKIYLQLTGSLTEVLENDRIYVTQIDRWVNVTKAQMDSSRDHWELEVEDSEAVN